MISPQADITELLTDETSALLQTFCRIITMGATIIPVAEMLPDAFQAIMDRPTVTFMISCVPAAASNSKASRRYISTRNSGDCP